MDICCECGRLVAGQTLALNQKFLGRNIEKFMCIDCLAKFLGTTREVLFGRIHDFIEIEHCELFVDLRPVQTKAALKKAQSLPLSEKFRIACERITEWYYYYNGQVYISFSGGKDSTVLLHIVRQLFPDVEAVFVNTGLEYPEIQKFVKMFDNVTILRPEISFVEVIKKYGYPMISKEVSKHCHQASRGGQGSLNAFDGRMLDGTESDWRTRFKKYKPLLSMDFSMSHKCCDVMKKKPAKKFEKETGKKAILATMAAESEFRTKAWIKNGCNAFDASREISQPMSFWTEQDVYLYIKQNNIAIASVYGDVVYDTDPEQMRIEEFISDCETDKLRTTGCSRTGCIFCGFGCHLDKSPSRFESLKETHPRQYEYCMGGGEYDESGKWQPNKKGLGLGHVFDELNEEYGDDFIKY